MLYRDFIIENAIALLAAVVLEKMEEYAKLAQAVLRAIDEELNVKLGDKDYTHKHHGCFIENHNFKSDKVLRVYADFKEWFIKNAETEK